MTASRPSTDLTVPDAALAALDSTPHLHDSDDDARRKVIRIARPVVAQFLRDLAAKHDRVSGGVLGELADQLDPQAGEDGADR